MKIRFGYPAALLLMLLLDALWLGLVMKDVYRLQIGHLFGENVVWWAAIAFYLLYTAAILYFAVLPSRDKAGAFGRGALLGITAYMTYDLTNQATLRDWPVMVTVLDIIWGAGITGIAAWGAKVAGTWGRKKAA